MIYGTVFWAPPPPPPVGVWGRFQQDFIDFQSAFDENGLELMAKDIRTQPASPNFIPTPPNIDLVTYDLYVMFLTCVDP